MAQKIEIIVEYINKNQQVAKRVVKEIDTIGSTITESTKTFKKSRSGMQQFGQSVVKTTKGLRRFKMEYLGILFAGMALQRFFGGIMRAAVNSFTKIMESSGYLGTAVQRLGVHWEYLKFVVGSAINSALEPLIPLIVGIVDWLSDWIQQHPMLTSWILFLGVVIGTVMLIVGQFALAFNSIITALGTLGITSIPAFISKLIALGAWLIIIGAAALILNGIFGDWKGFDDWAANAQKNVGIVGKVILGLMRTLNFAGYLFKTLFLNAFDTVWMVFASLIDGMTGAISSMVNSMIAGLNGIIAAYNAFAKITGGKKVGKIGNVSFGTNLAGAAYNRIATRTTELFQNTPTVADLFGANASNGGGAGGGVQVTNNYNIEGVGTTEELKRMLDNNSREQAELIKRYSGGK